jgi:hypothetical protein
MKQLFAICIALLSVVTMNAAGWTLTYQGYPYRRTACDGPFYKSGTKITLSSGVPVSPDGKEFAGWTYGKKTYQPGATFVMPNNDVELVPSWKSDEAIEGIQSTEYRVQKTLRNGQIVILRDGMEFDVLGNKIK